MPKFKNMRHRVEFAYEVMNTDIYYEGDYKYTIEDHNNKELFEMLEEEQMDEVLAKIYKNCKVAQVKR